MFTLQFMFTIAYIITFFFFLGMLHLCLRAWNLKNTFNVQLKNLTSTPSWKHPTLFCLLETHGVLSHCDIVEHSYTLLLQVLLVYAA